MNDNELISTRLGGKDFLKPVIINLKNLVRLKNNI